MLSINQIINSIKQFTFIMLHIVINMTIKSTAHIIRLKNTNLSRHVVSTVIIMYYLCSPNIIAYAHHYSKNVARKFVL